MTSPRPYPPLTEAAPMARRPHWSAWLLPAFAVACWVLAVRHLSNDWYLNEQYHYGWFVPLLAAYLVKVRFERYPEPGRIPGAPGVCGILLVLALTSAFAMPLREANMEWRSMGWTLTAVAVAATLLAFWQAGGARWLRHFVFPVLFCFTSVPLFRQIEDPVMQWLMQRNAIVSVELLHWLGFGGSALGNLISLPNCTLGIDEACSGVRSLQSTLMLTLFLGELAALSRLRRLLLLLSGFAWALTTNVARTLSLAVIAAHRGSGTMEEWHDTAGYTVLLICAALVSATAWLLFRSSVKCDAQFPDRPPDFQAIAERFRLVASSAAAGLAILLAGFLLTEWWFRIHEQTVTQLASWSFRMPSGLAGFRDIAISPRVRTELRFDIWHGGKWKDDDGRRWQALYFRWMPGRNAVQTVAVHDPRACLAAAGMVELGALPQVIIEHDDIQLRFDAFHFRDGPQEVFVFNSLAEDVLRSEAKRSVIEDNSIHSRFAAALAGKRHLGQRRIEIAVWGATHAEVAEEEMRKLLDSQIVIEGRGH